MAFSEKLVCLTILGHFLESFWDVLGAYGGSFRDFGGSWKQVVIWMYLGTTPGRPQGEGTWFWVVNNFIHGGQEQPYF